MFYALLNIAFPSINEKNWFNSATLLDIRERRVNMGRLRWPKKWKKMQQRNFIIDLAGTKELSNDIKVNMNNAHKVNGLSYSKSYWLIANGKGQWAWLQSWSACQTQEKNAKIIEALRDSLKSDRCVSIMDIANALELCLASANAMIHGDLVLIKRAPLWVP